MSVLRRTVLPVCLGLAVAAGRATGAGFQIPEQGMAPMGMGMGAIGLANDLSAVYHNPAGLTQLEGTQATISLVGIAPKATYTRQVLNPANGSLATAAPAEADDAPIPVPAFAIARSIRDDLSVAFAVNAPFGLSSDYAADGPQRYITTNIALTTVYVGPYVAWQATPELSVGAGVQYVYAAAELGQHANYGGALLSRGQQLAQGGDTSLLAALAQFEGGSLQDAAYVRANEDRRLDGIVDVADATDNAASFNVGVLYRVSDQLQVGATFRKGVTLDVEGDVTLTVPAAVTQFSGGVMQSLETTGGTSVSLPDVMGVGVAYRPTQELLVTSEVNYHRWSTYEDLDFDFAVNDQAPGHFLPDAANPRDWDDTIALRLGAQYSLDDHQLRCGYLYDQSPIPDKSHGPELPMNDRNGVTLGYGIRVGQFTVDVAYAHLFIADRTVRLEDTIRGRDAATGTVENPSVLPLGDYESSANIGGLQLTFSF